MANRTLDLTDDVVAYVHRYGVREHPVLARLRERTAPMEMANMQIGPDQGAFMATIVRLVTPVPPFERPHQNGTLPALGQQRRDVRCPA